MWSRITPNTDTFHAVVVRNIYLMSNQSEIWYPWKKKKNVSEKPSNFLNVFGYEDGIISDVTKLYEGGIIL